MKTNSEHQIVLINPLVSSNQFVSDWRSEFRFRAFIITIPNTVTWVPIPNELSDKLFRFREICSIPIPSYSSKYQPIPNTSQFRTTSDLDVSYDSETPFVLINLALRYQIIKSTKFWLLFLTSNWEQVHTSILIEELSSNFDCDTHYNARQTPKSLSLNLFQIKGLFQLNSSLPSFFLDF